MALWKYPCCDVVVGNVWSNDCESFIGGIIATGRVSQTKSDTVAHQVVGCASDWHHV